MMTKPQPSSALFADQLQALTPVIESALRGLAWPDAPAGKLRDAMDYSLYAGGKRLRPLLCLLASEASHGTIEAALPTACALEILHTYSLIHDDLPAMDDDDLRRGKPTNHKVYGDATAILAGDAMQTHAFGLLAQATPDAERNLALILLMTRATGVLGMVGGQQDDLLAEGRGDLSQDDLVSIHQRKTGALISASLEAGAICAGATPELRATLRDAGYTLGLMFQVVDDILDVTTSSEELGKSQGKDHAQGKLTYPGLLGLDGARGEAQRLAELALVQLETVPRPETLMSAVEYMLRRSY